MKKINKYVLSRPSMIDKAYHDCMTELFEKAQPSANYDEYVKQVEEGKITDDTRPYIYQRHYLSKEETDYIVSKYVSAYRMNDEWSSNIDLLLEDLKNGCTVNKYVSDSVDENGNRIPGYRDYDHRQPLNERLTSILSAYNIDNKKLATELSDEVYDYIENRRKFYRFDNEESNFKCWVLLGCAPTTNKQEVIDYWKSQGKDINIIDRDPRTFWMIDEGYTEEEIKEELEYEES